MLKPRLRIPRRSGLLRSSPSSTAHNLPLSPFAAAQQRSIHATPSRCFESKTIQVPQLPAHEQLAENGVPGLYDATGFHVAYTQYQSWCLERLNELIAGTNYEGLECRDIANMTSREPGAAAIFNYASMAHNNHFFFEGLATSGGAQPAEHMTEAFREELETSFGSLETLQREMVFTAERMFGPGFVWLVRLADGPHSNRRFPFRVLATYLAGSPYPEAHWRRQATDMNHQGGLSDKSGDIVRAYFDMQARSNNMAPKHGTAAGPAGAAAAGTTTAAAREDYERVKNPGAVHLVPVLCVNTWEHAWMVNYGVGGKFAYLKAWWDVINWGKVAERASVLGGRYMSANPSVAAAGAG